MYFFRFKKKSVFAHFIVFLLTFFSDRRKREKKHRYISLWLPFLKRRNKSFHFKSDSYCRKSSLKLKKTKQKTVSKWRPFFQWIILGTPLKSSLPVWRNVRHKEHQPIIIKILIHWKTIWWKTLCFVLFLTNKDKKNLFFFIKIKQIGCHESSLFAD